LDCMSVTHSQQAPTKEIAPSTTSESVTSEPSSLHLPLAFLSDAQSLP
jgi:hypothetical protein